MKWLVSGSRCKDGKIFNSYEEAYKEMIRQMMKGARESGISEWEE